jgi:hypothetical protein
MFLPQSTYFLFDIQFPSSWIGNQNGFLPACISSDIICYGDDLQLVKVVVGNSVRF